ncbi:hypothetical protein B9Z19DRAFT_1131525 [Tuber borchii]|uniref:Myb/SANT-like domain-containing protein n=1 Tax=Tuber borchii TaxID=42251 RepID=A0A2T6ZIU5_TUBBO|nr:hypothetical protein B9Z19DRAFT_1131525 [Tuber borchii]
MNQFNEENITGDSKLVVQQLKSRTSALKKKWKAFNHLLNSSGFGWDQGSKVVTAAESVWQDYLKSHPDAAKFQTQALENYMELNKIFHNTAAMGFGAVIPSNSQVSSGRHCTSRRDDSELGSGVSALEEPAFFEEDIELTFPEEQLESESSSPNSSWIDPNLSSTPMLLSESYAILRTSPHPTQPATKSRKRRASPETEKISGYADQIVNEISGLVADISASKQMRDSESDGTYGQNSTNIPVASTTGCVPAKFQQYAEALGIVMTMYRDGRITRDAVKIAVKVLESNPISGITFTQLLDEFLEDWINDVVIAQASNDSNIP